MVVGNGMLAAGFRSFETNDRYLVFAAGVSNSQNLNENEFKREEELLERSILNNPGKIPVYFSTYSILDPSQRDSVYVQHKHAMEDIVTSLSPGSFILRVTNVAGNSPNATTILNYFFNHIQKQVPFELWTNACRNIIDLDDLVFITTELLKTETPPAHPINIGAPVTYKVSEIIQAIENFLNLKASYKCVEKGSCIDPDLSYISEILERCPSNFNDQYLESLLKKYYSGVRV